MVPGFSGRTFDFPVCRGGRTVACMPRSRSRLLAGLTAIAAVALSGCEAAVVSHEAAQPVTAGPVALTTSLCAGNGVGMTLDDSTECEPTSQAGFFGTLLAAYEVPEGTTPLGATFVATGVTEHDMSRSPSFEALLESSDPAAPGAEWVAYQSQSLDETDTTYKERTGEIVAAFRAQDGAETFPYRAVIRHRDVAQHAVATPVTCDSSEACRPLDTVGTVADSGTLALRDVGVSAGTAPVTAARGATTNVPFSVSYAGTSGSGALPVSASTTVPGGGASAPPTVSFDAAGERPLDVAVTVPQDAPTGLHDVTVALGDNRTATARIDVPAPVVPPVVPPVEQNVQQNQQPQDPSGAGDALMPLADIRTALAGLTVKVARRTALRKRGLSFTQRFVVPGTASWVLRAATGKKQVLGRATRRIGRAGVRSVALGLTKQGRRALAGRRIKKLRLVTTFTDASARKVTVARRIRVR